MSSSFSPGLREHPLADSSVGLISSPQPGVDSGFRSQPSEQSASRTPTPSYPVSSSLSGSYMTPDLSPSLPDSTYSSLPSLQPAPGSPGALHHTMAPYAPSSPILQHRLASLDSPNLQHRLASLDSPILQHRLASLDSTILGRQPSPANGIQHGLVTGSPVLGHYPTVSTATQSSPALNRQPPVSQGTQSSPILSRQSPYSQPVQSSPVLSRQPSIGQATQSSPVFVRQPSIGQPAQSSPVLSRQPSLTHPSQGSPVLGRHPSISQVTQGSPSLDRHPMYSGYNTPDERHGALSRQSSSSGYHPPSTPSFPISPAGYMEGVGFRQGSPAPQQQPQLPEKRRMSSGERPNGGLSYGTLNGKMSSPMSSGGSTPNVQFFHTLPDFSKLAMCGKADFGGGHRMCTHVVSIRWHSD